MRASGGPDRLKKIYDQYNRIVLYNKARMFAEAGNAYEDCERMGKRQLEELNEKTVMLEKEKQRYQELAREEEVLKKEKRIPHKKRCGKVKGTGTGINGRTAGKGRGKVCKRETGAGEKG